MCDSVMTCPCQLVDGLDSLLAFVKPFARGHLPGPYKIGRSCLICNKAEENIKRALVGIYNDNVHRNYGLQLHILAN